MRFIMSTILNNMTVLNGLGNSGDVELNFYKNTESGKMVSIEFISRKQEQSLQIDFDEIDNIIAMLKMMKTKQ